MKRIAIVLLFIILALCFGCVFFSCTAEKDCSKGHNYERVEHVAPMGSTDGYDRYKCSRCGDTYDEVISAPPAPVSVWNGADEVQPTTIKNIEGAYYYEIHSAAELAYLHNKTEGSYNYTLACDIVLNDVELRYDDEGNITVDTSLLHDWQGFTCTRFEGNGYKISGLYCTTGSGLFSHVTYVNNLRVVNAYIDGAAGGIANGCKDANNCHFEGVLNAHNIVGGGLFGTAGGSTNGESIKSCTCRGLIIGTNALGGIVGSGERVQNCTNYAKIIGGSNVGGICGSISLNIMAKSVLLLLSTKTLIIVRHLKKWQKKEWLSVARIYLQPKFFPSKI